MLSVKGRLVKYLLQHRHWFQLKLKKELVDWNQYESILKFRQEVEEGAGKFGKMPASAVAYSPITDFTCSGESHQTKMKVCLSPEGMASALAKHYAGDQDLTLPTISPLYGHLQGLPPLLIFAGEDETLRDDAVMFGEKAKTAGVDITLHIGEGMFHCYPATAPLFPEATQAFEEICAFVKSSTKVQFQG